MAYWTDEEQLAKIIKNANTLEPILIGKIAPDIELEKEDKSPISLHDVDSEYTILYTFGIRIVVIAKSHCLR